MPSASKAIQRKPKSKGKVRFEVHVLVPRGSNYTGKQMHGFAADWANGDALPAKVRVKIVAWSRDDCEFRELRTPALIDEYRESFAGLLRAAEIQVRKSGVDR